MPFAVFSPAFDIQASKPAIPSQTGDKSINARAYIDRGPTDPAEISANRRKSLEYYRNSPIWPVIEAKLPDNKLASAS